jgi:hypothetical protein
MMNLILKPVVALAATVVIGASMLSPVLAASSHNRAQQMRSAPTYQQEMPADAYNQYGNGSWSNDRLNQQGPNFGQGNRCITDEGYGRWSYCDGGSN